MCEAPAAHRDRIALVVAGSCMIFGCTTSHPPTATVEQSEPVDSHKSVTVSPLAGEDAMHPEEQPDEWRKLSGVKSHRILGAPHVAFSRHIRRIKAKTSASIVGPGLRPFDFQRQ